ncbi:MAG: alpha/beta hydrolase [Nitrospira sp.]
MQKFGWYQIAASLLLFVLIAIVLEGCESEKLICPADIAAKKCYAQPTCICPPGYFKAEPRPKEPTPKESAPKVTQYKNVEVFFGTDRQRILNAQSRRETFNDIRGHAIHYGSTTVSIPHSHRIGELESPWHEYLENPEKHVVLQRIKVLKKSEFMDDIKTAVFKGKTNEGLIFVHGFNTTFEDAARRTAQIAHDIGFAGVPLFYSWPSSGNIIDYVSDGNNADYAVSYLKIFLKDIVENANFTSVTLLAHSMGNRTLTQAFIALKNEIHANKLRIVKEIILAAPDIDADVFKEQIAPALIASKTPVTLYASSTDRALLASKALNGAPRAGDSGTGLVVIKGMETLDATNINTNLFWDLNHSFIGEERSILSDLSYLIVNGLRASARYGLEPIPNRVDAKYWKFKQ